ncbi:unnamed protein product, partial [Heterosigma akashiwo]
LTKGRTFAKHAPKITKVYFVICRTKGQQLSVRHKLQPRFLLSWTGYTLPKRSSLLLKLSLENMEMSSEAWKERPNRPSICFNSTNIHFYSSLNQKQAAKYIFGGPLAPNMLPE